MNGEPEVQDESAHMRRISRRSFVWAGVAVAASLGLLHLINGQQEIAGIGGPFRKGLEFNEKIWKTLYGRDRLVPTYSESQATASRQNGDYGLTIDSDGNPIDTEFDPSQWTLSVEGVFGLQEALKLTIEQIRAMPSLTMTTEFFCIEGWSFIQTWTGVPMRTFAEKYPPQTISGQPPDVKNHPGDLVPYVGMATPDGNYWVGLDMESALHKQTMLCYEMNGKPLEIDHGAPLRLVIPTKYGVKNIKRIGTITYTQKRPRDFWAEQGYDWYAGL